MKKNLILISLLVLGSTSLFISGCNKGDDDSTSPVITIIGDDVTITKGDVYVDAGAEATDETDGNLTTKITVNSNVNTSIAGVYTVVYTVKDDAGNSDSKTRNVTVSYSGAQLAGVYNVIDTCSTLVPPVANYQVTFAASGADTYKSLVSNWSDVFTGTTTLNIVGNTVTIPLQSPNGTGGITLQGSGTIYPTTPLTMRITYTVDGTDTCSGLYTLQ